MKPQVLQKFSPSSLAEEPWQLLPQAWQPPFCNLYSHDDNAHYDDNVCVGDDDNNGDDDDDDDDDDDEDGDDDDNRADGGKSH